MFKPKPKLEPRMWLLHAHSDVWCVSGWRCCWWSHAEHGALLFLSAAPLTDVYPRCSWVQLLWKCKRASSSTALKCFCRHAHNINQHAACSRLWMWWMPDDPVNSTLDTHTATRHIYCNIQNSARGGERTGNLGANSQRDIVQSNGSYVMF